MNTRGRAEPFDASQRMVCGARHNQELGNTAVENFGYVLLFSILLYHRYHTAQLLQYIEQYTHICILLS